MADLTDREAEVVACLVEGRMRNIDIAATLVVTDSTAHFHVNNVLRKLGLRSRSAVAIHAYRTGAVVGGRWVPS